MDHLGQLEGWSVERIRSDDPESGTGVTPIRQRAVPARSQPTVALVAARPDRVEIEVNGVRMVFAVHVVDTGHDGLPVCYVDSAEGSVTLRELPHRPHHPPRPGRPRLPDPPQQRHH
jgi:propionyl-CoA carboxylase alpha chain